MEKEILEWIKENNVPIVQVDTNRNYWLVRTNSGMYFQDFLLGDYIGINWNEFNDPEEFTDKNKDRTIEKISKIYKDNKQPGHIFSHIKRFFHDMKIGDIVMIPSENSKHIAFGEIISDVYISKKTQTEIDEGDCPYEKRRNVKWLKTVHRKKLDPYLYRMMNSHLTISNADDYAAAIDRTMYSYYYKGDKAHLVLNINQQNNIALIDLLDALQAPLDLIDYIQDPTNPDIKFDKRDLDVKLRVQSPGMIEFVSIGKAFSLVVLLGIVIVGLVGGSFKFNASRERIEGEFSTEGLLEKILKFKKLDKTEVDEETVNRELNDLIEKMKSSSKKLEIKTPEELDVLTTKQLSIKFDEIDEKNFD